MIIGDISIQLDNTVSDVRSCSLDVYLVVRAGQQEVPRSNVKCMNCNKCVELK